MNSISNALEDIKKYYKIKKETKVKVKFGETTTLEFQSNGLQYVVVVYELGKE